MNAHELNRCSPRADFSHRSDYLCCSGPGGIVFVNEFGQGQDNLDSSITSQNRVMCPTHHPRYRRPPNSFLSHTVPPFDLFLVSISRFLSRRSLSITRTRPHVSESESLCLSLSRSASLLSERAHSLSRFSFPFFSLAPPPSFLSRPRPVPALPLSALFLSHHT